MSTSAFEQQRRTLIKTAAGLAAGALVTSSGIAATSTETANTPTPTHKHPAGTPGQFDFLQGEWKIHHRRLKDAASDTWDEFDGEATCWTILAGAGSVEELRIPARNFMGMSLRLLDIEKAQWNDFWVNAKSGVLTTPGLSGYFENGAGIFIADDVDGDQPIKVRGVWDQITNNSCRWQQSISRDFGASWQFNWTMDWRRA